MTSKKKLYKLHKYSEDDIDNALIQIRKGRSLGKVAKEYGIPKSTLHAKLTGKAPTQSKRGPKPILSIEEECRLKEWILNKAKLGFPMHPNEVKTSVQNVLNEAGRRTIFSNNRPGDKWQQLFLKRHPEITKKNTEVISKGRASVTEEHLREWFHQVKSYLEENELHSVLQRPKSIFNGDETGVQLCPKSGQLLGPKNEKDFYEIASGKEKETVTVLCTFSAAGDALPPMIMFPYKRIPGHIAHSIPDNWPIGRSDTGWMVSSTFFEYFANIFYPWCTSNGVEFPVIYFLDGHKSHLTLELSDFCIKHKIILFSLYPNATHIMQPCDVAIFRSLKLKWRQVVQENKQITQKSITKGTFAPLFKKAFNQLSDTTIKNGFKVCGLYPFDVNAPDYKKCISTRRKELNSANVVVNSSNPLTYNAFVCTKNFFDQYIPKDKIQEFENARNKNESCNDSVYALWKICIDELENDPLIHNDTIDTNDVPNLTQLNIEKVIGEVHEDENSMFNILDMPIVEFSNISEILNVDKIENLSPVHNNLVPSNETEKNLSPNPIDKVSAGMIETVMSLPDLNIQNVTETLNRNNFANGNGMHALNAETISSDSEHVNVLSSIKDELVTPETITVGKESTVIIPVHNNLVPSNETEENLSFNPIDKVSAGMIETVMSLPHLNIQNATETLNRNSFANGNGMHALNPETISSDSEHVNVLSSIKDELVTPETITVGKESTVIIPVHNNLVPSNETEENLSFNPIDKVSAGMIETVMSLPHLNIQNATETLNRNSFANGNGMHALNPETISSDSEHVNVLSSIKDELVTPETITVGKESTIIMSQCKSTNNVSHIWDKHLRWPSSGSVKSTKTEKKQQLPYAITSSKWREHEQKIREEKAKKELERKERILQRKIKNEENQLKKDQLKIERERKKKEREQKMLLLKENAQKIREEKAKKVLERNERILQCKIKTQENKLKKEQLKIGKERKQKEKAKVREEKLKENAQKNVIPEKLKLTIKSSAVNTISKRNVLERIDLNSTKTDD